MFCTAEQGRIDPAVDSLKQATFTIALSDYGGKEEMDNLSAAKEKKAKEKLVKKALKLIRKAHVKKRVSVEEKVEYREDTIVATDIELMRLRPFPEICKESVKNFKLKDKYAKIKNRGKTVGVKRKIFTDVLDAICAEEDAKIIAAEEKRKEKMALKERIQEESAKLTDLDKDVHGEQIKDIITSLQKMWSEYRPGTKPPATLFGKIGPESCSGSNEGRRKTGMASTLTQRSRSPTTRKSSRISMRKTSRSPSRRSSSRSKSRMKFGDVLSQAAKNYLEKMEKIAKKRGDEGGEDFDDEDQYEDFDDLGDLDEEEEDYDEFDDDISTYSPYVPPPPKERNPRNRPMSFVDKKIKSVQENRLLLIQQKEALIKKRLDDRIEKRKQNAEKQRLQALQTSWLLIVAHFSRLNALKIIVENHRSELRKWANASRGKKAVRDIEIWWQQQFVIYKLYKKFPWSRFAFATLFMNRWRKLRIAQRYAAQELVIQFVGDVTGLGETMRKVYIFRIKVKRVQEYVRMYFNLYFARLQVLWRVLQREEEKLRRVVSQGMQIKLRRARNSVKKIKGFGQKANMIEQVSGNISSLLKFKEDMGSRRKHKNIADGERYHKGTSKVLTRMIQWQADAASAMEDGAEKMEFIVELLQKLRHANVVKNDASKHRTIGKGPRSDKSDAKIFLSESNVSMPKLAASLAEMEDPTINRSSRHPFYMLTGNGGALEEIREWIDKYYKRKYYDEFMLVEEEAKNPTPVEIKKMNMF